MKKTVYQLAIEAHAKKKRKVHMKASTPQEAYLMVYKMLSASYGEVYRAIEELQDLEIEGNDKATKEIKGMIDAMESALDKPYSVYEKLFKYLKKLRSES